MVYTRTSHCYTTRAGSRNSHMVTEAEWPIRGGRAGRPREITESCWGSSILFHCRLYSLSLSLRFADFSRVVCRLPSNDCRLNKGLTYLELIVCHQFVLGFFFSLLLYFSRGIRWLELFDGWNWRTLLHRLSTMNRLRVFSGCVRQKNIHQQIGKIFYKRSTDDDDVWRIDSFFLTHNGIANWKGFSILATFSLSLTPRWYLLNATHQSLYPSPQQHHTMDRWIHLSHSLSYSYPSGDIYIAAGTLLFSSRPSGESI
jgi:hypothetical protein